MFPNESKVAGQWDRETHKTRTLCSKKRADRHVSQKRAIDRFEIFAKGQRGKSSSAIRGSVTTVKHTYSYAWANSRHGG